MFFLVEDVRVVRDMTTITIPRQMTAKDDLIIIPRKEYEFLLIRSRVKTFVPTMAQKRALARGERNLRQKKTLSYDQFRRALGLTG